jgi:hypothetical protein
MVMRSEGTSYGSASTEITRSHYHRRADESFFAKQRARTTRDIVLRRFKTFVE